eukprot:CCRYP_002909-RA/>CCRYP_002909-RA protein AED:0.32 eAED:0.35 QI:0/-1/0/1/-1/1/1/0/345
MAKRSSSAIHSRNPKRTKRKPAVDHEDAPTIGSSSIADQYSSTISPPCSPLRDHEIDITKEEGAVSADSPLNNGNDSESCSSDSSLDTIEQQREEGQQKLRELVIIGASSGDIDWKSIISLAEDLHKKEQRLMNSYKRSHYRARKGGALSFGGGGMNEYTPIGRRSNISRKQACFEMRSNHREHARRKKLESVGSFSVNLLLYGTDECTNYCGDGLSSKIQNYDSIDDGDSVEATNQMEIYEDEENASLSSQSVKSGSLQSKRIDQNSQSTAPSPIVEGSFLAATSMYTTSNFNENDDESSESGNSEGSCSTISFTGIELERIQSGLDDDDGLITIHEDASVHMW